MPPKSSSLPSFFRIYLGMMPLAERQQLLKTDRLWQDWRDPLLGGSARLRRRFVPRRVRTRARRDQAKQGDPPYRSGRWPERQKIKCVPRDTLVIVGYGGATVTGAIGRLLLAAKKGAELVLAGGYGAGWNKESVQLRELLDIMPAIRPPVVMKRRGAPFLLPIVVAEAWPHDRNLRHPSFKRVGERNDTFTSSIDLYRGRRPRRSSTIRRTNHRLTSEVAINSSTCSIA